MAARVKDITLHAFKGADPGFDVFEVFTEFRCSAHCLVAIGITAKQQAMPILATIEAVVIGEF